MTREILFRAKRLDTSEWVKGNLFVPDKVDFRDPPTEILMGTDVVRISFEVCPSTIGQYTGLTDKNGERIFEGDIVKHYNRLDDDTAYDTGLIFYDATQCRFKRTSMPKDVVYIGNHCCYEVIGNVYDNPELLEGNE